VRSRSFLLFLGGLGVEGGLLLGAGELLFLNMLPFRASFSSGPVLLTRVASVFLFASPFHSNWPRLSSRTPFSARRAPLCLLPPDQGVVLPPATVSKRLLLPARRFFSLFLQSCVPSCARAGRVPLFRCPKTWRSPTTLSPSP